MFYLVNNSDGEACLHLDPLGQGVGDTGANWDQGAIRAHASLTTSVVDPECLIPDPDPALNFPDPDPGKSSGSMRIRIRNQPILIR